MLIDKTEKNGPGELNRVSNFLESFDSRGSKAEEVIEENPELL